MAIAGFGHIVVVAVVVIIVVVNGRIALNNKSLLIGTSSKHKLLKIIATTADMPQQLFAHQHWPNTSKTVNDQGQRQQHQHWNKPN